MLMLSTQQKRVGITIVLWCWTLGAWAGDIPIVKLILLYAAFIMTLVTLVAWGQGGEDE